MQDLSWVFLCLAIVATVWFVFKITGSWKKQAKEISTGYHTPPNASKILGRHNTIIAFFVGFGWYGFSAYGTFPLWGVIINSIALGLFFVGFSLLVLWVLSTSEQNVHSRLVSTIGATGEVRGFVPSRRQGFGTVVVTYEGRTAEFEAITNQDFGIPPCVPITVVGIDGNRLIVRHGVSQR